MRIIVRIKELRAAMLFASTDETRFILNGVHVEVSPGKPPILIASDGRRLVVVKTTKEQEEEPAQKIEFTICSKFIKTLLPFALANSKGDIGLEYHEPKRIVAHIIGSKYVLDSDGDSIVEGIFPAWRKIVPPKKKEAVAYFGINAEYMGDFAAAAKLLGCKSPQIAINLLGPQHPVEVKILTYPNFYGVVMPVRSTEEPAWQPEFLGIEQPKEELVTA